ncbi:hypothetical protein JHN59_40245 [Streptomyces sp. MBT49]|uniref:hypothetical protein n=1 Tax=unclassified Streptomyces TaxID=2593676 RepID=UPI00190DC39C|nr:MULTISPECIES: hypothetical protein [unclassified Streptomyces]MBK3630916.1 hypothetical protein [Streptomyces sp. MBT49]MBK3637184.1 hypothetical protein [Streptomyces sp. MBT97]
MTRDKKRKAAIRKEQGAGGRRYAALARELTATSRPTTFPLLELLAECSTRPGVRVDDAWFDEWGPAVFESALIGTYVPYGSVLELAGMLATRGHQARLAVESVTPLDTAVLVSGNRRFKLGISQETVWLLCLIEGCDGHPEATFTHCTQHLGECDAKTLARMATDWGYIRSEDWQNAPAEAGGSGAADALIRASVRSGAFEAVRTALLLALFGDPDMFDDRFHDAAENLAVRHAVERERLRLYELGEAEARSLRRGRSGCTQCGKDLHHWNSGVPALLCFNCARPPGTQPQAWPTGPAQI